MKILCILGLHKWQTTQAALYFDEGMRRLAIPEQHEERQCRRPGCAAHQYRDEHCLGLNPPAYIYRWIPK